MNDERKKYKKPKISKNKTKGFIITCCGKEGLAVNESYNLLNEALDILKESSGENSIKEDNLSENNDLIVSLDNEMNELQKDFKRNKKPFQNLDTGVRNLIYISTTYDDTILIANTIFEGLKAKKFMKSRFILKLIPIIKTCQSDIDTIDKMLSEEITNYNNFSSLKSYDIKAQVRCFNKLSSHTISENIKKIMYDKYPSINLQYKNADILIWIMVIKNTTYLSFLENFMSFSKYNIAQIQNF